MANPVAAKGYGASTRFDTPASESQFRPSRIVNYFRNDYSKIAEFDVRYGTRVVNSGNLETRYPHAGILNTRVYLRRYPTTATNRNRARARWTLFHFLGMDVEDLASRPTDPRAIADTDNPTMRNPVLHCVPLRSGSGRRGVPELRRRGSLPECVWRQGFPSPDLQGLAGRDAVAVSGRRHMVPGHGRARLRRRNGAGFPQQRPVAREEDRWRRQVRHRSRQVLVARTDGAGKSPRLPRKRSAPRRRANCWHRRHRLPRWRAWGLRFTAASQAGRHTTRETCLPKWRSRHGFAQNRSSLRTRFAGRPSKTRGPSGCSLLKSLRGRPIRSPGTGGDGAPPGSFTKSGTSTARGPAPAGPYELLYGGIDSDGMAKRARSVTPLMAAVAQGHAIRTSCAIVQREFFMWSDEERRLFHGIDAEATPLSGLPPRISGAAPWAGEDTPEGEREPTRVRSPLRRRLSNEGLEHPSQSNRAEGDAAGTLEIPGPLGRPMAEGLPRRKLTRTPDQVLCRSARSW